MLYSEEFLEHAFVFDGIFNERRIPNQACNDSGELEQINGYFSICSGHKLRYPRSSYIGKVKLEVGKEQETILNDVLIPRGAADDGHSLRAAAEIAAPGACQTAKSEMKAASGREGQVMKERLVVKNLYKVFGNRPEEAMQLVRDGVDKAEIFARTGQTLGVYDASFTVYEGEIFVVMGLSGSGKSTLVRLLNRLIDPTAGQVLFDGVDIATMTEKDLRELRRRHISMVFQSFALMPHLTALQNAGFGLELAREPRSVRDEKAQKALDQVGLGTRANSYPHELSGGMQQRVGLARALANNPSVLLMDEAFSALDPLIRFEMQHELIKLQRDHKRTIIFISHDI